MAITLASKEDAISGGVFAGKVFVLTSLLAGTVVGTSGYGKDLTASASQFSEQNHFQLLALPSGEMKLFSNYAKSFVSGYNKGTPQHPSEQVLKAIVEDEVWSRFWLEWDWSDASFTLQSSFSDFYVGVAPDSVLTLITPEKPAKGTHKARAFFFQPVTIKGVPYIDPAQLTT